IYLTGSIIVLFAVISLVTGYLYSRFSAKTASVFGREIRHAQFKKIEEYSFSNIDKFEASSLVTRVINDSAMVQNTLTSVMRPLVRAPLMLILGIGLSFAINWELAIIFICLAPLLAVSMFFIVRHVAPRFMILQKSLDNLNLVIQENLIAIRVIKAFVRKDYQIEKFEKVNWHYTDVVEKTFRVVSLGTPISQVIMYTAMLLVMWFGGSLMINSTIEEGALTGVFSYVVQTFNSLMMVSNICISIARSLASCYRIDQVLVEVPTIEDGKDSSKHIKDGEIEFIDVDFKYDIQGKENVLENLNFKIEPGEMIGVIGSTGSGKSTLVELILRLYDVTNGKVLIDGENVKDYSLYNLREEISIVLQKNFLFSGSLRDNLKWGDKLASDEELLSACKLACVDEFLPRLQGGLDYELGANGSNVSGGQKQRICIARALLKKPKILILDDATSALDTATERRLIDNLKAEKNMTVIIITQRLSSLANCSRVLVLDNGRISGFDNKEKLLENNHIYADFYHTQKKGTQL
ncbi:MAG: ABC transporter ATP-binding protein, partial [Firmicutes bacterium]|nr:ABC transporter ATP-binding protein [Candidatus Scatoplasma merdavium]